MRVAFRVDSSIEIGSGHVFRCAALAKELVAIGASVTFICRELLGHRIEWLEAQGFSVVRLLCSDEACPPLVFDLDAIDLQKSRRELEVRGLWDWIVVDHYQLDFRWEQGVRDLTKKILVIDDLSDRLHDADTLIDCSVAAKPEDYATLLPSSCELLTGGSYALLRREFANSRMNPERIFPKGRTLHLALGGGEAAKSMPVILGWMLNEIKDIKFHVIVNSKKISKKLEAFPSAMRSRFSLECSPSNIASGMRQCDLSVGAPGGMTWERFCLGLPFAAIATHPTQLPVLDRLEKNGWLINLGPHNSLDQRSMDALHNWLLSDARLMELRRKIQAAVDGLGASRVANHMYGQIV